VAEAGRCGCVFNCCKAEIWKPERNHIKTVSQFFQASGYGSGYEIYDDTETGDEVKKVHEEREYPTVSDSSVWWKSDPRLFYLEV